MSLAGLLLFVLLPVGVGAAVLTLLLRGSIPDDSITSEVAAARRHAVLTSVLAGAMATLGTVVVLVTAMVADLGLTPTTVACAPLVGAAAALLALLTGELTWPRQRGATRTALLHDRTAASVLRGRWPAAAVASLLVTMAGLLVGGAVAAPDGRSISHVTATSSSTSSPFPGWHYGVPQVIALLVCVGLTTLVALAAVRRPAVVTASLPTDLLLRRASASRACRALACGTLFTLGADLAVGGLAATHVLDQAGSGLLVARVAAVLGPVVVLLALGAMFVPVSRLRDPVPPADAPVPA